MSKLGKRLLQAASEASAFARGELDPSTYGAHVPAEVDVFRIRQNTGLTREAFSARYGLKVGTLRDWEQGKRRPDGAARVLLTVIDREPEAVNRALAVV